jgi:hypothetical protein
MLHHCGRMTSVEIDIKLTDSNQSKTVQCKWAKIWDDYPYLKCLKISGAQELFPETFASFTQVNSLKQLTWAVLNPNMELLENICGKSLRTLDLRGCSSVNFDSLLNIIEKCQHLERLFIPVHQQKRWQVYLPKTSKIRKLEISQRRLGQVKRMLTLRPVVESLKVNHLKEALPFLPHLKSFSTDTCVSAKDLCGTLKNNPSLREISLRGVTGQAEELDLSPFDYCVIDTVLRNVDKIRRLILSHHVNMMDFQLWTGYRWPEHVEYLDLRQVILEEREVSILSHVLDSMPKLMDFALPDIPVAEMPPLSFTGDARRREMFTRNFRVACGQPLDALSAVRLGIKQNVSIVCLQEHLEPHEIAVLCQPMSRVVFSNLKSLDCTDNILLTDEILEDLIAPAKHLKHINVTGCTSLTSHAIQQLALKADRLIASHTRLSPNEAYSMIRQHPSIDLEYDERLIPYSLNTRRRQIYAITEKNVDRILAKAKSQVLINACRRFIHIFRGYCDSLPKPSHYRIRCLRKLHPKNFTLNCVGGSICTSKTILQRNSYFTALFLHQNPSSSVVFFPKSAVELFVDYLKNKDVKIPDDFIKQEQLEEVADYFLAFGLLRAIRLKAREPLLQEVQNGWDE